MNVDSELNLWREQWRSEAAVPADLHRRVDRQSRIMKALRIADWFVTVFIGGFTALWAVRDPQPDIVVLAAATWVFLAVAWAFSIRIHRGIWEPTSVDTATFVTLSIKRCESRLRTITFGAVLYLAEIVFCLGWIRRHSLSHDTSLVSWLFSGSLFTNLVWLFTAGFFCLLFWYRARKRAELAYLRSTYQHAEDESLLVRPGRA